MMRNTKATWASKMTHSTILGVQDDLGFQGERELGHDLVHAPVAVAAGGEEGEALGHAALDVHGADEIRPSRLFTRPAKPGASRSQDAWTQANQTHADNIVKIKDCGGAADHRDTI